MGRVDRVVVGAAFTLFATAVFAVPRPMRWSPGKQLSQTDSYWVAPYALYTSLDVGSRESNRIQWFDTNGRVRFELELGCGGAADSYVRHSDAGGAVYYSILNPDWKIIEPPVDATREPYGAFYATPDGRTLVRSSRATIDAYHDEWPRVPTTIEILTEGRRSSVGPFTGGPKEIFLDPGGTLALRLGDDWLVVVSRDGKQLYRAGVEGDIPGQIRGCDEHGILIHWSMTADRLWYLKFDGSRTELPPTDPWRVSWAGRSRAVFLTWSGDVQFVDCAGGRILWENSDARGHAVNGSMRAAILDNLVVVATHEFDGTSNGRRPSVILRAYELEDGDLVATWQSDIPAQWSENRMGFFEVDGKLLFVDGWQVCEIDAHEIREGDWIPAHPKVVPPRPIRYGPPASPLSWSSGDEEGTANFAPRQLVAHPSPLPRAVRLVRLQDERPYGESESSSVKLAAYDSVEVRASEGRQGHVTLSAAYDAETGNVLCAFTPAKDRWVVSSASNREMMERFSTGGAELRPADYDSLRSTPADVMAALWRVFGIDPRDAAQIVMRPRYYRSDFPARRLEGKYYPIYPPMNVWIAEVLGTITQESMGSWPTFVVLFRDSDLKMLQGTPMR